MAQFFWGDDEKIRFDSLDWLYRTVQRIEKMKEQATSRENRWWAHEVAAMSVLTQAKMTAVALAEATGKPKPLVHDAIWRIRLCGDAPETVDISIGAAVHRISKAIDRVAEVRADELAKQARVWKQVTKVWQLCIKHGTKPKQLAENSYGDYDTLKEGYRVCVEGKPLEPVLLTGSRKDATLHLGLAKTLGSEIKDHLLKIQMSQEQFAERYGVPQRTISQMIQGKPVDAKTAWQVVQACAFCDSQDLGLAQLGLQVGVAAGATPEPRVTLPNPLPLGPYLPLAKEWSIYDVDTGLTQGYKETSADRLAIGQEAGKFFGEITEHILQQPPLDGITREQFVRGLGVPADVFNSVIAGAGYSGMGAFITVAESLGLDPRRVLGKVWRQLVDEDRLPSLQKD